MRNELTERCKRNQRAAALHAYYARTYANEGFVLGAVRAQHMSAALACTARDLLARVNATVAVEMYLQS